MSWLAAAFATLMANVADPSWLAAWLAVVVAVIRIIVDAPKVCRNYRAWRDRKKKGA